SGSPRERAAGRAICRMIRPPRHRRPRDRPGYRSNCRLARDAAEMDNRREQEADQPRRATMKLYHFPSPNPQKVTFALKELGLDCELVPVDLAKGEQRDPAFLATKPFGRVPGLVDGDLTLPESQAILAYLGEKTGRLWPASSAGRANALKWLFFLSQHIMPPAGEV